LTASIAEDHSTHLIAQPFDFIRIGGAPEALGEIEEFPLFPPLSFNAILYEFQEHPVGAQPTVLRQAADLGGKLCR
jgi:hypothetical protein